MVAPADEFNQWSTLAPLLGNESLNWPKDDELRIKAYEKYDQIYWNDPTQYAIRVLEGEQPLYIPNARVIVNTTAYYLTKGLQIQLGDKKTAELTKFFEDFMARETFYSTYNIVKHTAIARGDGVLHIMADPEKKDGKKVSVEMLHPGNVYRVWDDDGHVIRADIAYIWEDPELVLENPNGEDPEKIRVLRYTKEDGKVSREELTYDKHQEWWDEEEDPHSILLEREELDEAITQIPIYWFKNIDWGDQFGSSELRGLELIQSSISQGATDTQASLGLEGLGVYATDGGRPVDEHGEESEWEVSPGKVMEVPQGSYFRRVEGVGSITPMMDQIGYLEDKVLSGSGITDIAIGKVDAQTAESGIALAIKFSPTLAKLEFRDTAWGEKLTQMFFDLKTWFKVYEDEDFGEVEILITWDEDKLPVDRKARLNELNNMVDRGIITKKYYREEAVKLGYKFPEEKTLEEDFKNEWALEALKSVIQSTLNQAASQTPEDDPEADEEESNDLPPTSNPDNGKQETKKENKSNNIGKVNESKGTEA